MTRTASVPTILLIGAGDLGGVVLELLARTPGIGRIMVADLDFERAAARANLARLGALAQGHRPVIDALKLDVYDHDGVVAVVRRERPEIILSTATLLTWWLPERLPPEAAAPLRRAGFGVWLPVHLAPTLRLMQALEDAGHRGHTLTAPYPDVVNCVLGRLGLAPTSGIGNVAEIVPKLQALAAARLGAEPAAVKVTLVAHHALERFAYDGAAAGSETPPYFLRIMLGGVDVTERAGGAELLLEPHAMPSGPVTHFLSAATAVRLIQGLLADEEAELHAPGPGGLPGGYPVLVSRAGVRPAPVPGLPLEQAIAINERSHRFDGIERIERDGTVVFTATAAGIMRETLGYDRERLHPDEADERAAELVARFWEYARRYGVTTQPPWR